MEQIKNFNWAQDHINEITNQSSEARHVLQQRMRQIETSLDETHGNTTKQPTAERRFFVPSIPGENRAQRRKRQRKERRAANKKVTVRA